MAKIKTVSKQSSGLCCFGCCSVILIFFSIVQMMACVTGIIKISYPLVRILVMKHVDWLTTMDKTGELEDNDQFGSFPVLLFTVMLICLFVFILLPGFVMGIVLLFATITRRASLLRAWLFYSCLILTLFIGLAITLSTVTTFIALGVLLIAMIFVNLCRKEMERRDQEFLRIRLAQEYAYAAAMSNNLVVGDYAGSDSGEYAKCGDGYEDD